MGTVWRVLTRKKVIDSDTAENTRLARVLNTFDLTALGVGSTLGVGVYVLAGHVARDTAGPAVVLSFLIAAIASVFAGLCYAEFGARTPRAGSAYIYSYICVGEFIAFVIGWNLILEYVIGSASVARGLSLYLDTLINNTLQNTFIDIAPINVSFMSAYFDFFSFGLAVFLSIGLAFGMKESTWLNNLFTILNVVVVLFVIIAGSFKADIENWNVPANETESSIGQGGFFPFGIEGMIRGAATCFYGFVGFDCIATTGEEVKNPKRAIPIAIILSLTIIFLSYFGTSTVITMMVPYYAQDINAPIPHAFADVGWNVAKWIVSIGGIFGLCASLFGAMFPLPRIIYAMASDGLIFKFLGIVNSRFSTPVIGTLLAGLLTGLMSAMFELRQLVNMMSIGTLMAYTIVAACVLLLRYSIDEEVHHYSLVCTDSESDNEVYKDSSGDAPTVNSDPHVEDANDHRQLINDDKLTLSSSFKQLFNSRGLRSPSRLTEKLAAIHVALFCFLSLLMGMCAMFLVDEIQHGKVYAIVLTSVVGFLLIFVVMSLSVQPTSSRVLSFKVPLVPLIPALSILVNIYLMLMLDASTWIRFGIWMIIGILIYIFSVRSYSHARNTVISNKSLTNGHANGTLKYIDEIKMENSDLQEEKTNSTGDSGIESYNQKTSIYGSMRSIESFGRNDDKPPHIAENEMQTSHDKKSLSSIDVALATLDDMLNKEELASGDVPSRKTSVGTVSNASNVPVHENVVALVHREDVVSKPASPLFQTSIPFLQVPFQVDSNKTGKDFSQNEREEEIENKKEVTVPPVFLLKVPNKESEKDANNNFDQNVKEPEIVKEKVASASEPNDEQSNIPPMFSSQDTYRDDNPDIITIVKDNLDQIGPESEIVNNDIINDIDLVEEQPNNNEQNSDQLIVPLNNDVTPSENDALRSPTGDLLNAVHTDTEKPAASPPSNSIPIPPPMEDFVNHTRKISKVSLDDRSDPSKPHHLYIKQKTPASPAIQRTGEAKSRRPSEVYLPEDNIRFGSSAHNNIIEKLNVFLKSNKGKLTKPEAHEAEELPAKSNTLKPVMSQIISEIIKANIDDEDKDGSPKGEDGEKNRIESDEKRREDGGKVDESEDESGVDTRPVAPSDIRKRLNEIFRSDPRTSVKPYTLEKKPYVPRESSRNEISQVNNVEDKVNLANDTKQEHQEKMGNVFATIRLRKAASFNSD